MPLKSGSQGLPFDPVRVGSRFEFEREKLGLSRAELARLCEYSPEQVRRVERGEQAPGAKLLAALAEAGGDIRGILLGAGEEEEIPYADAIHAAELRDRWRKEAREHARLKADARKKVLSDEEVELIDAFRDLGRLDHARVIAYAKRLGSDDPRDVQDASGAENTKRVDSSHVGIISSGKGARIATGDYYEGGNNTGSGGSLKRK